MTSQKVELAPLKGTPSTNYPNSYIVIFKENLSTQDVSKSFEEARRILKVAGSDIKHEYNIGPTFQGFSATMSESVRDQIRGLEFVKYVEYDQEATVAGANF